MTEKLITPPPVDDYPPPALTSLDTEGRFSLSEVTIVDSGEGYHMPIDQWGRALSPMETGTNVVLPIVASNQGKLNRHHAYFYKRHYMKGSLAVHAVRHSRLQRVNEQAHKTYHKRYFGTLMPPDETAAAMAVILNSAGYVANLGVRIVGDDVAVCEITPQERNRLRKPGVFSVERPSKEQRKMADFLIEYALKQNFDHVRQSQIEEFLELTPRKTAHSEERRARKLQLGLRLTNIALNVAVDPVEPDYREARRRRALRKGAPSTAWQWAKGLIKGRELVYMETLETRLIDEFGATA